MKVMIGTPTAGIVHAAYAMSLTKLVLYFLGTPVFGREKEERHVIIQMLQGANIGMARDKIVESALEQNCSHVLFIDDDMGFREDCLNRAAMRQMPIVLANYRRKIPPGHFTAQNADNTGEIITNKDSRSLEECYFGGFGFCLIERQVLEATKMPRFLMYYDDVNKTYTTEDKPFFEQAHNQGFKAFVDHEISKRVWHNGSFPYSWDMDLPADWAKNRNG